MEDWEEFFVEKSRRRFDKERAGRLRLRRQSMIAGAIVAVVVAVAIVALAFVR